MGVLPRPRVVGKGPFDAAVRHQVYLERLASEISGHVQRKAGRFARDVYAWLDGLDEDLRDMPSRKAMRALAATDAAQTEILVDAALELTAQLPEVAGYEAEFNARLFQASIRRVRARAAVGKKIFERALADPIPATGELLEDFVDGWAKREVKAANQAIAQGFSNGLTNAEIKQALRGTRAKKFRDGLAPRVGKNADAVVRTSVQHVANTARAETYDRNADIVEGYQIVATLDGHTTQKCFVGSTIPLWIGGMQEVVRAQYAGEIVNITTASGKKLEGTPNHPILTTDGFLPLGKLQPGKHVVYTMEGERGCIGSCENVGVPASFAELYDALNEPARGDVFRVRSSARDFYGDGVRMHDEIDVLVPKRELGDSHDSGFCEFVKHDSFCGRHASTVFGAYCSKDSLFFRGMPVVKSSTLAARSPQNRPNPLTGSSDLVGDFGWSHAVVEQLEGRPSILDDLHVTLATFQRWHDTLPFEHSRNGCGGNAESSSEGGGALPITIGLDNIVSVVREFRNCHVFTLSDSPGFYSANGILVKNCRSLDGRVFPLGKGPMPPFHVRCRTTTIPEVSKEFAFLDEGATRSSVDGPVDADETYYGWLKGQSAEFQDEVLGPERGKLFRDGGLTADEFARLNLDRNFEPLTLDEMRRLEPKAFARAGL